MKSRMLLSLTYLFLSFSMVGAAEKTSAPRNIIYFMVDDLGRNDCGFMGGKDIQTPNIDRLAKKGVVLDAFYVQPVCSPTRAAFMTGRYPMRYGLQQGVVRPFAQYGLPLEETTLAQKLQQTGYRTAICGKWHLGTVTPEYLPTKRGFDYQYGHYLGALDYFTHRRDGGFDWHENDKVNRDEGYSTSLLAQKAAAFVRENAGKKKFFLYVPFNGVHTPLQAPEKYLAKYPKLTGDRKKLAAMLSAVDEAVGEIVQAVETAGEFENTLFLFSSDNGGYRPGVVTDNGLYRAGKGTLYEGGTRVCAFMTWSGVLKPGLNKTPMHVVDLYPTLVTLCGGSLDAKKQLPLDGVDIWPCLTAQKKRTSQAILYNLNEAAAALRLGNHKLVVTTPKKGKPKVELFDLQQDPYEKNNIADQEPSRVSQLREQLEKYRKLAVPSKQKPQAPDFVTPKIWGEK